MRNHLDQVPLTLLGELCAGQLVELASDAELGVFLATAESPKGPPIIEATYRVYIEALLVSMLRDWAATGALRRLRSRLFPSVL